MPRSFTMASIPKPREHDLQVRDRAIIAIFGEIQDPGQPTWSGLYEQMRKAAKKTYWEIVKPENTENKHWNSLPDGLKRHAMDHLMESARSSPDSYYTYFERSESYWLPEYLLRSYCRYHVNYEAKKAATATPVAGESSSTSARGPPTSQ
ncbi:hypothetical protein TWF281_002136 [Arthrobotrys megalospora]